MLLIGLDHASKTELKYGLSVVHFSKRGIPQGTILGPLLFLLYINDLPNCLTNSYPRMYPDYTHLTYADKDVNIIQSCLNEDLLNISKWLIANKLTLNRWFSRYVIAAMLVDEKKRFLISSFCSFTSNCTLQHCYLCP